MCKHQVSEFVTSPRAVMRWTLEHKYPAGKGPFGDSSTYNAKASQLRGALWGVNAYMDEHLALVLDSQLRNSQW